jgi:diguanylate cyclase (GGDEF)-like protein
VIRILFIEDLEYEMELALSQLKRAGVECVWRRADTAPGVLTALEDFAPTIVLSDFSLPQFDGLSALALVREHAPDLPFLFLSGTIGEERAIEALRRGAVDYVLKTNMARLAPAVRRAVEEAAARGERRRQEAQIARLNRVLKMVSGVNGLIVRIRDRAELLREACRLAVSVGGYTAAVASSKMPGTVGIMPVAWNGADEALTESLRAQIAESSVRDTSIIGRVLKSGDVFVCNNTNNLNATASFNSLMISSGLCSLVALPLMIDGTAIGALLLAARDSDSVSEEELRMLREVAASLSFSLQYMQKDTTVRFLSHFDPHTGLANRALFCERVGRLLASAASRKSDIAIAVIDIERLSVINDSFGRRMGDLLLQQISERLKRRFGQPELLAHFSGGTFALVRERGADAPPDLLAGTNEHVGAVFGEPFLIEKQEIRVSVRTGLSLYPRDGKDAAILIQNAEAALRNARGSREKQFQYNADKLSEMVSQLALENKLKTALERQQFEMHYQPKVNVVTRRIQGVEALLRWRSPEGQLISPGAFLPVLESSGLIVAVGSWVIEQAARDCAKWQYAGLPPVRVAVNISPAQLEQADFVSHFLKAVRPWSTADWGLDVEITEGALHENSSAEIRKLKQLRSTGIRIAIDDFGTGYSSLSRLSSLPIDTLKIDRCFVQQALRNASGSVLVKTIVELARAFGMTTVAEGVEKQEELDLLWQMGCDQSQGFLHSPAVPATEFAHLLEHGRGRLILAAETKHASTG